MQYSTVVTLIFVQILYGCRNDCTELQYADIFRVACQNQWHFWLGLSTRTSLIKVFSHPAPSNPFFAMAPSAVWSSPHDFVAAPCEDSSALLVFNMMIQAMAAFR